ncbi:MAG TPA: FaeA/PapI family transcriptional regulator [Methanothrix sp.]|nr:FaeA/PapI family transcriptional regulator [Methanothrix sp.]HPJ83221.1 FaeA/PapI family transcriptional regulator [Methanothrix sp.]HPR66789.1 FaeA/PapI family transcriptional regulator [Methanothrix sp.]
MASYEERILKAIEDSEVGLTTVDVAKQAGVSKTTAIKYLSVLKSEGKCEFVEVGPSKLWRASELGGVAITPENVECLEDFKAALKERGGVDMPPLKFSVVAQLEEISDDVTISMSFKVKPEKVGTFMNLMKKCVRQTE